MLFLICLVFVNVGEQVSSQQHQLVTYWGQNAAGPISGQNNYEKPLAELCQYGKFDVIALAFLTSFYGRSGSEGVPELDFAFHCDTPISPINQYLLKCPEIEKGIKECQRLGTKVILSIGGPTGDGTIPSPAKGKELANTLFDFFLGGSKYPASERPFGDAVLDGIDLYIEGGAGTNNYPVFIKELRRLMIADTRKQYLITGAPQCPFPDHFLKDGLENAGQYVDHLYVKFYNNYCHTGNTTSFESTLRSWLDFSTRKGGRMKIFIGVPAATGGASDSHHYRPPSEMIALWNKYKNTAGIGGVMLWDSSWDQNNVIEGKRYSSYVYKMVKDGTVPTTQPPMTTQAPVPPGVNVDCTQPGTDGLHKDYTDCSKYIQCLEGKEYKHSCPTGLNWNDTEKFCDWPSNVTC